MNGKAAECAALQTLRDIQSRHRFGEAFGVRGIPALYGGEFIAFDAPLSGSSTPPGPRLSTHTSSRIAAVLRYTPMSKPLR